jgi:predicted small lipoprotein YifL
MKRILTTMLALGALVALAACGGGGGSDSPTDEGAAVPASALESPESFSRWVGDRRASESRDPLAMGSAMPPTSETAEPIDVE